MRSKPLFAIPAIAIACSLVGAGYAAWYFSGGTVVTQNVPLQITAKAEIGKISIEPTEIYLLFEQNKIQMSDTLVITYSEFNYQDFEPEDYLLTWKVTISGAIGNHILVYGDNVEENGTSGSLVYSGHWDTGYLDQESVGFSGSFFSGEYQVESNFAFAYQDIDGPVTVQEFQEMTTMLESTTITIEYSAEYAPQI